MERGVIFRGLREPLPLGHPTFPPTYKFDKPEKGTAPYDRLPYDRSEKRRIPAWTDRVFYRGSRPGSTGKEVQRVRGLWAACDDKCMRNGVRLGVLGRAYEFWRSPSPSSAQPQLLTTHSRVLQKGGFVSTHEVCLPCRWSRSRTCATLSRPSPAPAIWHGCV